MMNKIAKLLTSSLLVIALLSGVAMGADHWTENFDTGLASSYTTGTQTLTSGDWTTANVYPAQAKDSRGGTGHAAQLNDNKTSAFLATPAMNTAGTVTFYYCELNDGGGTFSLEKSYNNSDWSSVTTQAFSGNTYTLFSYDVNDNSSTIYLRVTNDNNDGHLLIDDFTVTDYAGAPSPTIVLSPATLSDFSYVEGSGPSAEKTFTVTGSDLTANISLAASTNYEISKTSNSGYTSPLTLTQSGGSVAETPIYVRLKSGLADANYNTETIVATSTGATAQNVTCSGTVWEVEPTTHVSDFAEDSKTASTVTLKWTTNGSDGYVVTANANVPADGIEETDANGQKVVGNTGTATVEGLSASTAYTFKIYPFNNSGSAVNYKTDGTVSSVTVTTEAAPAAVQVIISEVTDPADVWEGRYVEIYNAGATSVDLTNWQIRRYANANTTSANINLSGSIAASEALVIAYSETNYRKAYGATENADFYGDVISGNGNDTYELYNGAAVVDIYGEVGTDGTGEAWEYLDSRAYRKSTVTSPNTTWTASEWVIESANVLDMTPGVHTVDGATPITLAAFTATAKAGVVELAWETASETNNAQFVIYRNDDVLATVEGAGTTSETNNYVYVDETVVPGAAYTYVLADVDYANNETRYDDDAVTVTVGEDLAEADFVIGAAYPNPFNPTAIVPLTLARDANVTAKIYSLTGREIATLVNGTMSAGYHDLQINASDMTTGLYIVRVVVGDVVDVQKIAYLK